MKATFNLAQFDQREFSCAYGNNTHILLELRTLYRWIAGKKL